MPRKDTAVRGRAPADARGGSGTARGADREALVRLQIELARRGLAGARGVAPGHGDRRIVAAARVALGRQRRRAGGGAERAGKSRLEVDVDGAELDLHVARDGDRELKTLGACGRGALGRRGAVGRVRGGGRAGRTAAGAVVAALVV